MNADAIARSVAEALWRKHHGGEPPADRVPAVADLCAFDWPAEARDEAARRLDALYGQPHTWLRLDGWMLAFPMNFAEFAAMLRAVPGIASVRVNGALIDPGWTTDELAVRVYEAVADRTADAQTVEAVHAATLAKGGRFPHPLAPIVEAWQALPRKVAANLAGDRRRIIPAKLAMFEDADDRRAALFSPAAHVGDQGVLPGFEDPVRTPALPLALYDLGINRDSPGPGAPIALRLFVEAILATPIAARGAGPTFVEVPLRVLLNRLWPHRHQRRSEWLPKLKEAEAALASDAAAIPWEGGSRKAVLINNFPLDLDDKVRLIVDLPPGAANGPQVSNRLHLYGPASGPAYRALLNFSYWWHEPGVTLVPAAKGHWLQVDDPKRYRRPTDEEIVNLVFPRTAYRRRRAIKSRAEKVLAMLVRDGELRMVDGKPMPPKRP